MQGAVILLASRQRSLRIARTEAYAVQVTSAITANIVSAS